MKVRVTWLHKRIRHIGTVAAAKMESRTSGPHKQFASGAAFFARLPERRSTGRPSSLSFRRPRGPAPSDRAPPQVNLF